MAQGIRGAIIIPARNEAKKISFCLDAIMASEVLPELDVLVVCNDSSDETAAIARSYPQPVRCLETPLRGKARALELGRKNTADLHRLYIDADIVVSLTALSSVLDLLDQPTIHGAAPRIDLADSPTASWLVRQYGAIWRQAPYFSRTLIGAGFFGLDATAQARIGPWPDLIADDLVALCHLAPHERAIASGGTFRHTMPSSLRQVAKSEVRREAGRIQFAEWVKVNNKAISEEHPGGSWLWTLLGQARCWIGLVTFITVKTYAKIAAGQALRRGKVSW